MLPSCVWWAASFQLLRASRHFPQGVLYISTRIGPIQIDVTVDGIFYLHARLLKQARAYANHQERGSC